MSSRLLWLLRHAKAVPDPPVGGTDHDRPLRPRGRRDAEALGRHFGPAADLLGLKPETLPGLVLCSSARRTVETAEGALALLDPPPPVQHLRSLYAASTGGVLDEVRLVDDEIMSVMVVGHNPTMQQLASALLDPERSSADPFAEAGFPTGGLAVLRLPIDHWIDAAEGTAELVAFHSPPY